MKRQTWLGLALILLLSITMVPALAQTPTPNEVNAVAKELWCPLCNGVRLDNCELQACVQMREVIAQKLMEGASKDQIKAYFVQQYGDVVLGAPSNEGFNRLAWVFPILAAIVGLGWLAYLVRAWLRRRPITSPVPTSGETQATAPKDKYLQRVDDELKRYE